MTPKNRTKYLNPILSLNHHRKTVKPINITVIKRVNQPFAQNRVASIAIPIIMETTFKN